jgi:hypothetical protein
MYAQSKRALFLDRRKAAPTAMSVDQTGHQQLCAVTDDVGTRIFGCDFGETAGLLDGDVDDYNRPGRDHARCSEARISDRICAAHDDGVGHDLAPLQISTPTGASPANLIAVLTGLLSPEAITNATTLVKARTPFSLDRPAGHGLVGLACEAR